MLPCVSILASSAVGIPRNVPDVYEVYGDLSFGVLVAYSQEAWSSSSRGW